MVTDDATLIEGVGDEVLAVCICMIAIIFLCLAWYSTYLTPNQTQLINARVRNQGVTVNRVPGSSSAESRAARQNQNESEQRDAETSQHSATNAEDTQSTNVTRSHESQQSGSDDLNEGDGAASADTEESQPHDDKPDASPDQPQPAEPQPDTDTDLIHIKIKFLTDSERIVTARISDTISAFKRSNFSEELEANKLVRLIYNGQVLSDDRTLQSYNITDNTVVHALVSDNTSSTSAPASVSHDVVIFNAGSLMVPLFTIILAAMWYLRLEYGQFFNFMSTVSLICITVVFVFSGLAQLAPQQNRNQNQRVTVEIGGNSQLS